MYRDRFGDEAVLLVLRFGEDLVLRFGEDLVLAVRFSSNRCFGGKILVFLDFFVMSVFCSLFFALAVIRFSRNTPTPFT